MELITFFIVVFSGLAIGTLSGMFGIGGGTMIVPLLNLFFGVPIATATATSLFTIAPTAISGAIRHLRQKTVNLKAGIIMGCSGTLTSVAGAILSNFTPALLIAVLTVAIMLYSSITMLMRRKTGTSNASNSPAPTTASEVATTVSTSPAFASTSKSKATTKTSTSPALTSVSGIAAATAETSNSITAPTNMPLTTPALGTSKNEQVKLPAAIALGLFAGLMAGLVGVGGGFIIVPICFSRLGFTMKRAVGTSLVAIGIIAIPGIIAHIFFEQIAWIYGLALIVGSIPGAQLGAWLITKAPERALRIGFCILLFVAACLLLAKNIT